MPNLIPISPVYDRTERKDQRAFRIAVHRTIRAKNLKTKLEADFLLYRLLINKIPRNLRAQDDLFQIGFIWEDSPHIALPIRGVPSSGPKIAIPSRSDLRIEARRNHVSPPDLWQRFPPSDLFERKQMYRELAAYAARFAQVAKTTTSGFQEFVKKQAKEMAKSAKRPELEAQLLSNSDWKAEQKKVYDGIIAIDLDISL